MKYILILLTAIVLSVSIYAQPQHVGATFSYANSDGADGNGSSLGFIVQGKYDIPKNEGLSIVGESRFSRDLKGYLNERGNASRSRLLARYERGGIFAQAGFYAAHIRFANTSPAILNGYGKSIVQPVAGFGYSHNFTKQRSTVTADYLYFIKGNLHATDSNGKSPVIDGSSVTHRIGINGTYEFAPKWLLLANFSWNENTYVRSDIYGPALAGIKHRSQGHEFQIGIGRRF